MKIVGGKWSNWSGSVVCRPREIVAPRDEVDLAAAIRKAEGRVRFPGTGYSFTPLNATNGTLIDLSAFVGLKGCDPGREVAVIAGATPLWGLGSLLHPLGYALKNMCDIDRQTLGGAVATGTHGTGITLGSISADVASFRLLLASGQVLHCSPDENAEIFAAGRTAMGMLGVMTEIDMKVRPFYKLVEKHFVHPIDELFHQLDGLVSTNRHFEFFWFPYSDVAVCKSLNETEAPAPTRHSARTLRARGERRTPDEFIFAGVNELLRYMPALTSPAHKLFSAFMPGMERVRWSSELFPSARTVRCNEMEYAVPYAKSTDALREVVEMIRKKRINTAFPIEFRTVAADDIWLSPFSGRESGTISVRQYYKVDARPLFESCEAIFRAYEGRPHWGKMHTRATGELSRLYPKYEEFRALRRRLDPKGKFLNDYLEAMFD